ncbi:unknown [Bacteroides sp. CAG:661]|nr:unknown [Bacteroides sp. CAG:661]
MGYVVIVLIVVCVLAWGQYYRSNTRRKKK